MPVVPLVLDGIWIGEGPQNHLEGLPLRHRVVHLSAHRELRLICSKKLHATVPLETMPDVKYPASFLSLEY
jgi:hypothetical protein